MSLINPRAEESGMTNDLYTTSPPKRRCTCGDRFSAHVLNGPCDECGCQQYQEQPTGPANPAIGATTKEQE